MHLSTQPSFPAGPRFATSSPPFVAGSNAGWGPVMVSPSSLHAASAAYCSSGETLLTVLSCANLASLPQEPVHHELLQPAWGPSTGSGSPRDELPQCKSSSEPRPFSGSAACCSTGFSTGCEPALSPLVISDICKDWRGMVAPACLTDLVLTNLGDLMIVFQMVLSPSVLPPP